MRLDPLSFRQRTDWSTLAAAGSKASCSSHSYGAPRNRLQQNRRSADGRRAAAEHNGLRQGRSKPTGRLPQVDRTIWSLPFPLVLHRGRVERACSARAPVNPSCIGGMSVHSEHARQLAVMFRIPLGRRKFQFDAGSGCRRIAIRLLRLIATSFPVQWLTGGTAGRGLNASVVVFLLEGAQARRTRTLQSKILGSDNAIAGCTRSSSALWRYRARPDRCWRWNSDKKALHTFVRSYFASRNADGAPQ